MTQDEVLKKVLACVMTLPDTTRLSEHSLSKPYVRVRILPDGSYKEHPCAEDYPKAIRTVGDLRTIPFHVLLSYPRLGSKKITQLIASLAEKNGLDVSFVKTCNIIPTEQKMRVIHALYHGFAVVYDKVELPEPLTSRGSKRSYKCHAVYEYKNGQLVSTKASKAYHGQPGNKAGISGQHPKTDLYKVGGKIEGKSSYVLTEKGREIAEATWGKTKKIYQ